MPFREVSVMDKERSSSNSRGGRGAERSGAL